MSIAATHEAYTVHASESNMWIVLVIVISGNVKSLEELVQNLKKETIYVIVYYYNILFSSLGIWPSYWIDLLSMWLVEIVGARIIMCGAHFHNGHSA